jgi:hypothetical protein
MHEAGRYENRGGEGKNKVACPSFSFPEGFDLDRVVSGQLSGLHLPLPNGAGELTGAMFL